MPDPTSQPKDLSALLEETALAWREILPSVDSGAIELVGRLETLARWVATLKTSVLAHFQLNFAEWTTLTMLRISAPDCRRSPTELRYSVGQTSAGMTRILGKLEQEGLVERESCAEDGRRSDVVLTSTGREIAERSFEAVQSAQSELLEPLGKAKRDRLKRELDGLISLFSEHPHSATRVRASDGSRKSSESRRRTGL